MEKVNLAEELPGKAGKVRWKRLRLAEPPPSAGGHPGMVNLHEALGANDDAVAYAYTEFTVPEAREVEFRGAAQHLRPEVDESASLDLTRNVHRRREVASHGNHPVGREEHSVRRLPHRLDCALRDLDGA